MLRIATLALLWTIGVVTFPACATKALSEEPSPRPQTTRAPSAPANRRIKLFLTAITDYTSFGQDATSLEQVGTQPTGFNVRAFRFGASGTLGISSWVASIEYKGLNQSTGDPTFGVRDLFLRIPVCRLGTLIVGRTLQPFVYEQFVNSSFRSQTENILDPFFTGRSTQVGLTNTAASKRMTWTAGAYNLDHNATQYISRVTGLPDYARSGADYVHLAVSYRYEGADNGTLRFKGKPESSVASDYVDTGAFPASGANELGSELLANFGPLALTSEFVRAWVDAPLRNDPRFYGYYVMGSWIITGEHRPYERDAGFAGRIVPQRRSGAWELVARFSRVDLTDQDVRGGVMNKTYAGMNWWGSAKWVVQAGYGSTGLDRFEKYGHTESFLARVQFIY